MRQGTQGGMIIVAACLSVGRDSLFADRQDIPKVGTSYGTIIHHYKPIN